MGNRKKPTTIPHKVINLVLWCDYDNSDTVQVMIDGKYYLTHYSNVILVSDQNLGGVGYLDVSWYGVEE